MRGVLRIARSFASMFGNGTFVVRHCRHSFARASRRYRSDDFTVWLSLVIGFLSIVLSILNLVLDFPKQVKRAQGSMQAWRPATSLLVHVA